MNLKFTILWNWQHCHRFTLFFNNFSRWLEETGRVEPETARQELLWEYDDLFKGTHAGIYIPLWASACKGRGDILMDAVTLDLIKTYNVWGYTPADMDGNPPDFIGQQFHFLCYLRAAALHALENGDETAEYEQAAADFTAGFLLDTVREVCAGIRRNCKAPVFAAAADELEKYAAVLAGGKGIDTGGISEAPLPSGAIPAELSCYGAYQHGRFPPRPDKPERLIPTTCTTNCGGRCALLVREQEDCILEIKAAPGAAAAGMRPCARGLLCRETYMSGRRLRYPMRRAGERGEGRFRRISWEEAADIAAAQWLRIRDNYGPQARYVNYSSGVQSLLRPDAMIKRLANLDGGHLEWYNSYSTACIAFTMPYIYGDNRNGNSLDDILNTRLIILWGFNPDETVFGSERGHYLDKAKEKGIPIVAIDPRQSDTALSRAGEWIGIRPSTDAALADALAFVIWSEGLQDQHFMDTYCLGFDENHMAAGVPPGNSYHSYLFGEQDGIPKTAEWAEAITGVAAETIRKLARRYAQTKPACLLQGWGPQRTACGEQTVRGIAMLACLTGNVGISGGSAGGPGGRSLQVPGFPVPANPCPGKIPSFAWTTAIERGTGMTPEQDGLQGTERLSCNIKLMCNFAGNVLINQHGDINNTIRILKDTAKCEFIMVSDVLMTSSACFADLLLPAASSLEQENIALPWNSGHYILHNARLTKPLFGSRFEYFFIEALAGRIGLVDGWTEGCADPAQWLEKMYAGFHKKMPELPDYETFKKQGGYFFRNIKPYIAYADQIRDPPGHPFNTPSGKIEIFSRRMFDLNRPLEVPAIPRYVPPPEGPFDPLREKYPLQLIGYHTKRRTHSTHDTNPKLERLDPQRLWMNPLDAGERFLADGDMAEIFNDRGRIRIPVFVTRRIIPGVTALSQGAWYTPDKDGTDILGSINVLTSARLTPFARGNAHHTCLVEVRKYG
ncbi:dimethyl sulfoxide reductase subunit A [Spirochaetia bacterium]|nr:dimethyl sulfoxide reductase subunit A [Spirochaetia bacterium]